MGHGKTRRDVLNIARAYDVELGKLEKNRLLSDGWWCHFKEKQDGKHVLRKGDNTLFL